MFPDARLTDVEEIAQRIPELGDIDIIEALGSLVDKSMVRSAPGSDGRPRFSMLQTIRAYATEQLDAIPELAAAARRAHAEHYTELAAGLHKQLTFAGRGESCRRSRSSSGTCGRRGTSGPVGRTSDG